ncbi:hypothetical protein NVP1188A_75 [Vibrio phage 1.188.A._10N.286.51.A6]|uniref:Uncharacterized protein n=3 Tax=Mukerjeevirus mv51A6 TaxID=2734162 RepID=A0A2I7RJ36_9CAUD|nr:hypothetical protein HOU77_gp31 [Vibrio phage 1.188.A._10N.286.51.A6]AUR93643.1 hypothetical protein NVP1188A_75 [Vibrio phage 1.188.A._10N.286.51.A6]AUR93729.1 hypothetical protein NVP1188B_75 [Vibrio phage 1.188.B._10N.286.51.A6]AUR93815.1 hypothetical protein NVP1188C_75 [Vibrio phage 1.188.C._10N.286.51.A6]
MINWIRKYFHQRKLDRTNIAMHELMHIAHTCRTNLIRYQEMIEEGTSISTIRAISRQEDTDLGRTIAKHMCVLHGSDSAVMRESRKYLHNIINQAEAELGRPLHPALKTF